MASDTVTHISAKKHSTKPGKGAKKGEKKATTVVVEDSAKPEEPKSEKKRKTKDVEMSAPVSNKKPKISSAAAKPAAETPAKVGKTKKSKAPSPEVEAAADEDDEPSEGGEDSDSVHLHGFSTDDDSSDEEDDPMDADAPEFDVAKLPTIAKDDVTVRRKLEKAKRQPTEDRGVLYVGRLPRGFYEDQLRAYFSQFGTVTRLRLSRNKRTGASKHCGFIEFDSSSVAQIVADTMDNYLIMGHLMRCKIIPKADVHPELWVGANRKWRGVPIDRVTAVQHNKYRTETEQKRAAKRLIKRQGKTKRKLEKAGIDYSFDSIAYKNPAAAAAVKV